MNRPCIEVGILSAPAVRFKLNGAFRQAGAPTTASGGNASSGEGTAAATGGTSFTVELDGQRQTVDGSLLFEPVNANDSSFELLNVVIGVQFHWEREEDQRFRGALKLFAEKGQVTAVNILPLEEYLLSVISSEMSAASSVELLKAHAVISRSWLLAQIEKGRQLKGGSNYRSFIQNADGYLRWYDREDHDRFDVCADDHCQRYQGVARVTSPQVYEALQATEGEVLTYNGNVCDARFYKSCGGITEQFENVWEPVSHPYMTQVVDSPAPPEGFDTDLTKEENARRWILSSPPAFCNTGDRDVLAQVLNDYDLETQHFYRWKVVLAPEQVRDLLARKINVDVGDVLALEPVERGMSGRLIRLRIVGSKGEITIGKELEIRKALSESHLYSSAFVVDKTDGAFVLHGAGWGHGVGLCQIGAAIMGDRGYSYREILSHYFPGAALRPI